jgi:hypothetical protein
MMLGQMVSFLLMVIRCLVCFAIIKNLYRIVMVFGEAGSLQSTLSPENPADPEACLFILLPVEAAPLINARQLVYVCYQGEVTAQNVRAKQLAQDSCRVE